MAYNVKRKASTESGFKLMPTGINKSVELTDVTFESIKKDKSGDPVLCFHFSNSKGESYRHVEFPVDEDKLASWAVNEWEKKRVAEDQGIDVSKVKKVDVIEKRIADAFDRHSEVLTDILSCFITEASEIDEIFDIDSYEDLAANILKALKGDTAGVKLNLKLVLSGKKEMLSIPKFGKFVELAPEDGSTGLIINTKDKLEKIEPDDEPEPGEEEDDTSLDEEMDEDPLADMDDDDGPAF